MSAREKMIEAGREALRQRIVAPPTCMCDGCLRGWAAAVIDAIGGEEMAEALATLVAAKDMKEAGDDGPAYRVLKSLGWNRARAALAKATGGEHE